MAGSVEDQFSDPPKSIGTMPATVLLKISTSRNTGDEVSAFWRSDENELARPAKRPGADCLPVVPHGISLTIQKNLEAAGLEPLRQSARVLASVTPRIRNEKVISEYQVQQTTPG